MRLDGFISQASGLSRKDAKRTIARGRVRLAANVIRNTAATVPPDVPVYLDDVLLTLPGERYLMLNKPGGVISASRDNTQPVVMDLLPAELTAGLHTVGRLDKDTTGLLLLTSDGQWSHRVTSPRRRCPKTYRVTLAEPLSGEACEQLASGILLKGDHQPTRQAQVTRISDTVIDLTLEEGRYHQVKRMLAAVGNHVTALHRHRIGAIRLDPELTPGQFRALTATEIASFGDDNQDAGGLQNLPDN